MELKRIEAIYAQLGTFTVELSPDAWSFGPKHIHDLISTTRGYLNSVSFILQEILQEKQRLDREKHAAEAVFSIESDRLLAQNDQVRHMPSITDRQSTINVLLRDHVQRISEFNAQLLDIGYVEKVVRHRYVELKGTMSDIKVQRALIRDAIDTGQFYGDENDASRGGASPGAPSPGKTPEFTDDELDREMSSLNDMMLGAKLSERDVAVSEEDEAFAVPMPEKKTKSKPKPEPPPEPAKAAKPPAPKPSPPVSSAASEDDFSDLIEGLESVPTPEPTPSAEKANGAPEDPDLARFLDGDDFLEDDTQSV